MKSNHLTEMQEKLTRLRKAIDEDLPEGMNVLGDDESDDYGSEDDAAEEWLKQQEAKQPKGKSARAKKWEPGEVTPKQAKDIKKYIDEGHTEKEAHWLAGEKVHGTQPEHHSSKVLDVLKDVAKQHMSNEAYNDRIEAPEHKSDKYKEGRTIDAMEHHTKDYKQAYNDFLNSDDFKGLSPRERHKAKREFQSKWKEDNPEHANYHENVRETAAGETPTGSAQRKSLNLQGDQKKWFDYTVNEHMPEIEKNIAYLRARGDIPPNVEQGDLIAHGVTGLMDALSRYREDAAQRTQRGGENTFTKYAGSRIRGKMLDHVSNERGQKSDGGGAGMSSAEAAQHLGVSGAEGELPGMSVTGGAKQVSSEKTGAAGPAKSVMNQLSDEQKQRMINIHNARMSTKKGGQ